MHLGVPGRAQNEVTYPTTPPGFMSLIGSFEGYLMVYRDIKLAWTTKLQTAPIFVSTASFQEKQGLIVTLSDQGHL